MWHYLQNDLLECNETKQPHFICWTEIIIHNKIALLDHNQNNEKLRQVLQFRRKRGPLTVVWPAFVCDKACNTDPPRDIPTSVCLRSTPTDICLTISTGRVIFTGILCLVPWKSNDIPEGCASFTFGAERDSSTKHEQASSVAWLILRLRRAGSDLFLRRVGQTSTDFKALYLSRLRNHCSVNLNWY
jgi:hypothetical protein